MEQQEESSEENADNVRRCRVLRGGGGSQKKGEKVFH